MSRRIDNEDIIKNFFSLEDIS